MNRAELKHVRRWVAGWNDAMFGRAPQSRARAYLDGYFSISLVA